MMQSMKKRVLAFLLCAVMLFSLCPSVTLTALADDEAEEQETVILDDGENELLEEEDPTAETGDDTDLWEDLTAKEEPDAKEEPVADEDHAGEESAAEEEPYDPTETLDEMEADLPYELPDNRHEALAAVAASQLGYEQDATGYTRYADWCARWAADYSTYGEENYHSWDGFGAYEESWDAAFVTFCLYYAGVPADELQAWPEAKLWAEKSELAEEDYDAIVGDLVFLDLSDDDDPVQLNANGKPVLDENGEEVLEPAVDTVGIISRTGDDIWAIVKAEEIKVDAEDILGIAALPEKPADEEEPEAIDPESAELNIGSTRSLLAAGSGSTASVKAVAAGTEVIDWSTYAGSLAGYLTATYEGSGSANTTYSKLTDSQLMTRTQGSTSSAMSTKMTLTNNSNVEIQLNYKFAITQSGSGTYTCYIGSTQYTTTQHTPDAPGDGPDIILSPGENIEIGVIVQPSKPVRTIALRMYNLSITELAPATSTVTFVAPTEGGSFAVVDGDNMSYTMEEHTVDPDTTFTLTPSANTGYVFDYWKIDDSEDTTLVTNNTVTASALNGHTLSAVFTTCAVSAATEDAAKGSATVSPSGNVAPGTSVQFSAAANTDYEFTGWYNGDTLVSENNPYTCTTVRHQNITLTAHFRSTNATVNFNNTTGGTYTIVNSTTGVNESIGSSSATASVTKNEDTTVTLTATPDSHYRFAGWYKGETQIGAASETTKTITLGNYNGETITAHWASTDVTTTFAAADHGSYTIGSHSVTSADVNVTEDYQTTLTWTATPDTNYHFVDWYDQTANTTISTSSTYTSTLNDYSGRTVTARFAYDLITQTFPAVTGGTYQISTTTVSTTDVEFEGRYDLQYTVSAATPDSFYTFVGWVDGDGNTLSTDSTYTFYLNASATVKPSFRYDGIHINFKAAENGSYTIGSDSVTADTVLTEWSGTTRTWTATAVQDYHFVDWYDQTDDEVISTENPYTHSFDDYSEHNITARFAYNYVTQIFPVVTGGTYSISGADHATETVSTAAVEFAGVYNRDYTVTVGELQESYRFDGWVDANGNTLSTSDTYTFRLDASATVKPVFTFTGLTVTFQAPANGSITVTETDDPSTAHTVFSGTWILQGDRTKSYTLTANLPGDNYGVDKWTANNTQISTEQTVIGSLESYDGQTVTVSFKRTDLATYKVGTSSAYKNGSDNNYSYLDQAIAATSSDYKYIYVVGDGVVAGSDGQTEFTIPSGYTLVIPYSSSVTSHTTSPALAAAATRYLYRSLTVPSGVSITVNGSVNVDSQMDQTCGKTSGAYGMLVMEAGSSMTFNSGAYLYCWGYINGDGNVIMNSGSYVYEGFQLGDWRGGSATSSMINNSQKVFPINQYFVQNVEAPLTIYAGAIEKVYTCVRMKALINTNNYPTTCTFITTGSASDGMFRISSGYITKRYLATTDHLLIEVHGTVAINSITISISSYSMVSSKYVLPITNNLDITVAEGSTVTAGQDLAFLAGSVLTIDDGGVFSIPSGYNVYVYDEDEWTSGNYATSGAKLSVSGFSTANGTKTMRDAATLKDVTIDVNGTLSVTGKLYTTTGGANITSSLGTGKIEFKNATTDTTTTYQATQSDTSISYSSISCTTAKLHNGDGSYSLTTSAQSGWTFYYDKDYEHWYRFRVNYSYDGNIVYKSHYCIPADCPFSYTVDGMASISASSDGNSTVNTSGTTVNVTAVTGNSTVTITGTPYTYTPVFMLNATQYNLYKGYTGNALSDTRTVGGTTYYVVREDSAMSFGATLAAPTDADMGVTTANHNSIAWKLSDSVAGNAFLGSVPSGGTDGSEVYIYGIYSGYVAYNSFTDKYYTTLYEAMSFVPMSGTTTVRLLADCGSFETEDATANYTIYAAANVTLDLNGHAGVGRITNNGNLTVTDTSVGGGGRLTTSYYANSSTLTAYGALICNNAGARLAVSDVSLAMTQSSSDYDAVIMNYGGASRGTITELTNVNITASRGYCLFNLGGQVNEISGGVWQSKYGIMNRNYRQTAVSNGVAPQLYSVGNIDLIEDTSVTCTTQYALYNSGTIGTIGGDAEFHNTGTSSYVVFNSNCWYYDSYIASRTESGLTRTDVYVSDDNYIPTIGTITGNVKITSTTCSYALHNQGNIGSISGSNIEIKAKTYALNNVDGGKIESISGTATIAATAGVRGISNTGQANGRIVYTYPATIGTNSTHEVYTYGRPSQIGSISGNVTISATTQYGLINGGYIGAITGGVAISANYDALYNSGAGSVSTRDYTRYYTDTATAATEYKRVNDYTRNLTYGGVIDTISGVSLLGTGTNAYLALDNYGYIGTLTGSTVGLASGATGKGGVSYPLMRNGDSRQSSHIETIQTNWTDSSGDDNVTVAAGVCTRYDRDYTYTVATINNMSNVTVTSDKTYALVNAGKIVTMSGCSVTGTQYSLYNSSTGPYTERKTVQYYSGASIFSTTKSTSELPYWYERDPAEITIITGCTITTPANTYALQNAGHIGTIENSTLQAGTTTAKALALYNGGNRERSYDYNLEELLYVYANGATACTAYYGTNGESKVIVYDYDAPVIDLIGAGNTITGTTTVIQNYGTITAINSGEGTPTVITASAAKGSAIYNATAVLDTRTNTTPYTAASSSPASGTAGTAVNSDTYLSGAQIGTIKNTFINANGYGILNGSANASYLPIIGEIGEGTEIYAHCTTADYAAIHNTTYAKISAITGGLYKVTKATTYAYKNNNTNPEHATLISGGDFQGNANTRAYAILEPDNTNRQTYPTGKKLSTGTEDPTETNANMSGSYYFITSEYTVTFDVQGHSSAPSSQTVEQGQKATAPDGFTAGTTTVTESGVTYRFGGWYKEAACTNAWDFDNDTVTTDTELFAKWTALYTVTWKSQDGGTTLGTSTVVSGNNPVYPDGFAEPTKEQSTTTAYTFSGWATSANQTSGTAVDNLLAVTGNITYYAAFSESGRVYSINLNYQTSQTSTNGTTTTSDKENTGLQVKYTYGGTISEPSIRYYKLVHWTIGSDTKEYSTSELAAQLKTMVDDGTLSDSTTVKAFFVRKSYTIEIYSNVNGTETLELTINNCGAGRSIWINASQTITQNGTEYPFKYWIIGDSTEHITDIKTSYFNGEADGTTIRATAYYSQEGEDYTTVTNPQVTVRDYFTEQVGDTYLVGMTLEVIAPTDTTGYSINEVGFGYTTDAARASAKTFAEKVSNNWEGWTSGTYVVRFKMPSAETVLYSFGFADYTLNSKSFKTFATYESQVDKEYSGSASSLKTDYYDTMNSSGRVTG